MSDKKDIVKEYSTDEITIVWKPNQCIHSEKCFKGLPAVFNPNQRPWVNKDGASAETIANQIKKCPSGALSYRWNDGRKEEETTSAAATQIQVLTKGPLLVKNEVEIELPDGTKHYKKEQTALCRCGGSGNKPFCDGSHKQIDFE
jgi:uncharacterized Fe-S cluster protein YjdI